MSNKSHQLYTGFTTDLPDRVQQHKEKRFENAFTARYNFDRLVCFEWFPTRADAARREKQVKSWTRAKRVALIQKQNPNWDDLSRKFPDALRIK
jgi:putative endonuclease